MGELVTARREHLTDDALAPEDLGGELAMPGYTFIDDADVTWVEEVLDRYNENIPPSPLLSAFKVSQMYFTEVCKISVQNIAESPP